jgi:chromate transporter
MPTLAETTPTWARIAALSFGGPAGQIAVMHRILVDEKKWVTESQFLHALNYCMLLPGPEAQQLATYVGWLMHGVPGGLIAGGLFILPGALAILALSLAYVWFGQTTLMVGVLFGLKCAVIAIVFQAVLRIGKRVLKNRTMVALAAVSFLAIYLFAIPFPLIILAAALIGFIGGQLSPKRFCIVKGHGDGEVDGGNPPMSWSAMARRAIVVLAIGLTLWAAPLAAARYFAGEESALYRAGIFFSKAAVVTFGGAYSVLAYIAQQAVENYQWLSPREMADGLGFAETTPGPLIMVVQFVGFMGVYRNPGALSPLTAGLLGSALTVWVTFVPSFLWIFLGAPFVQRLREQKLLSAALSAITAAVVGVILNLAIWFALHVLFHQTNFATLGPAQLELPLLTTFDWRAGAVTLLAMALVFYWKRGMLVTLATCIIAGLGLMNL